MKLSSNSVSAPALDLPPPFKLVTLREVGDAFAHAQAIASEQGAGTLVHVGRFDLSEFALVLEPEEPLASARRVFYAGMVALRDALVEELSEVSRRILVLVGIVVPGTTPARVTAGLGSEDDTTRGLAEELVDVALGRRAPHVLAVVAPGLHPGKRLARLEGRVRRDGTTAHRTSVDSGGSAAAELVRSIAVDPDDTLAREATRRGWERISLR